MHLSSLPDRGIRGEGRPVSASRLPSSGTHGHTHSTPLPGSPSHSMKPKGMKLQFCKHLSTLPP